MRLPYSPEPIEQLQRRFPAALKAVFSVPFVEKFPAEGPSGKPAHVFDFTEKGVGYRVIVSIDEHPKAGRALHASVSCSAGMPCVETAQWAFA